MKTSPRGVGQGWSLCCLSVLLVGQAAIGQITLSGVTTVNVTPSSFAIIGSCSSVIDSNTTVSVSLFADAAGVTNLGGQLGLEFYPLQTGSPGTTNAYDRRLNQEALRQSSKDLGLVYVRVSGCSPNTAYYYSLKVSTTGGQNAVWPASGPLPSVRTPLENAFVLQSEQLVISLGQAAPAGAMVLLANTNTPSVLAAVVGDGAETNQAFFSINELLAAAGNTNVLPNGTQQFIGTVFGLPSLSVTQSYSLLFSTNFAVGSTAQFSLGAFVALGLGSTVVLAGQGGSIPITLQAVTLLTNFSFTLSVPTNRFTSVSLQPLVSQVASASLSAAGPNTLLLDFGAGPGQSLEGNQPIAQLNFVTASNQTSAFVPLSPQTLQGTNSDASLVSQTAVQPGRVVVIGQGSLLEMLRSPSGPPSLALYGRPGASYQLQYSTNLSQTGNWTDLMRVPMTNLVEVFALGSTPRNAFYRAYEFTAAAPILDIEPAVNGTVTVVLYGTPWQAYELDYANSLSFPITWNRLSLLPLTTSFQSLIVSTKAPMAFFRARAFNANPPYLEAHLVDQDRSLLVYGLAGTNYTLLYSTNLSSGGTWSPLLSYTLTNSFESFTNLGNAEPHIFYRIKQP